MVKRDSTIDSLRGFAILLVLIHHICVQCQISQTGIINFFLRPFITGGWVAVDLFFVLSGFLIAGLLFKEFDRNGKIDFGRFLIRRSFKIYPGFFVFLAVSLTIALISYRFFGGARPYFRGYVYDGLFLHNYLGGVYITTWSLDVEEAFYLLLPVFFFFVLKRKALNFRTIFITYSVLVAIGIGGRILAIAHYPTYEFEKRFTQTHYRLDSLFFGVLLSYCYHYLKPHILKIMGSYGGYIISASTLVVAVNFIFTRERNDWISIIMLSINPICFGAIMVYLIDKQPRILKGCHWLRLLGVCSYAIYLWHPLVNYTLMSYLEKNNSELNFIIYLIAYLGLSIVIGIAATSFIEKPILKFRDKHFASKSPAATSAN